MAKRTSRKPNGKRRHKSGATPAQRAARKRKRKAERAASAWAIRREAREAEAARVLEEQGRSEELDLCDDAGFPYGRHS